MIFIETSIFTKFIGQYLTADEYLELQKFLLQLPEAGKIIRERAESENYGGRRQTKVKVVGLESFTIGKIKPMKFGY